MNTVFSFTQGDGGFGLLPVLMVLAWLCVAGRAVYSVLVQKSLNKMFENIIIALFLLYPVGVSLKVYGMGPDFGRFYLSDIGFPVMLTVLFAKAWGWLKHERTDLTSMETAIDTTSRKVKRLLQASPAALAVSVAYEIFADYIVRKANTPGLAVGKFDWLDIAMYCIGTAAIVVVSILYRYLLKRQAEYLAVQRAAEKVTETERRRLRAQRQQVRKRNKKRVKRGVR